MKVFISGVTSEFGSVRGEVASDLRSRGCEVKFQDDFRQEADTATLLDKLHNYIRDCDAVVCLVGARSGWVPPEPSVIDAYRAMLPAGIARASYTQWELIFARAYGKRLSIYCAAPAFAPDKSAAPANDDPALQAAFVAHIEAQGLDRSYCKSTDDFCRQILREDWPSKRPAKPIALPYASMGTLFKGREKFLGQLRESLKRSGASAVVGKAIHGLGGVGKTRLAVEYAWQHQNDHTALLFVTADSPESLKAHIASLCGALVLDLPEKDLKEEQPRFDAAMRWLKTNADWFLIFDNVDTEAVAKEVEALLTQLTGGNVVITSRLRNWGNVVETLELDVLTPDAATDFLLERTKGKRRETPDDAKVARTVATDDLGQLALALEQAAAYIRRRALTFEQYRTAWRANDKAITWFNEHEMQYPRSVAVTWQTSVDQLTAGGRHLLERLAWFAPEPIPEAICDVEVSWVDGDVRDALADLAAYSLVARAMSEATFSVHRVVQDVTRRRLIAVSGEASQRDALLWIDKAFVGSPSDVRTWAVLTPLLPHTLAATLHPAADNIVAPTTRLLNQAGLFLDTQARFTEAEPLYRRALAIKEKSYGPDHPTVATGLNNLAGLLLATNRLSEAEPLYRRALEINETSYGPDHPTVAIRLNNLAGLLQATNRLSEAEPLYRRALAIDETSYGPDHPEVATDLNNLAGLLQATNRLSEAEPLYRRALEINETSYGPDHPTVATGLNNLAGLLEATNRLSEAEPLYRRALAIDEKSYGPDHPTVAIRLNNLAGLLQATNRLSEAEPLYRRALANLFVFAQRTGHQHPHLTAILKTYRRLLMLLGQSDNETDAVVEQIRDAVERTT